MTSVECQIIEGGVGDILVLQGRGEDGNTMKAAATCEITRDRDGEAVSDRWGEKQRFTSGRINWFGRDPDWKDVLGVRGAKDPDSPGQGWTTLECFVKGDTLTYRVNGVIVNRATEVFPTQGKILLQTEGAEMSVRASSNCVHRRNRSRSSESPPSAGAILSADGALSNSFNPNSASLPLVFGDAGLKEIFLLREIDRLTHPGERV